MFKFKIVGDKKALFLNLVDRDLFFLVRIKWCLRFDEIWSTMGFDKSMKNEQFVFTLKEIQMAFKIWIDIHVHNFENKIKNKMPFHNQQRFNKDSNIVWMRLCVNRHLIKFWWWIELFLFKGQIDVFKGQFDEVYQN